MNLKTLTGQVEITLANHANARNSDITLTVELWKRFHPEKITLSGYLGEDDSIRLKDLFDLPHESEIGRIRRKFQNDQHVYLPTDWKIAEGRGIKEEEWREHLGYPPKPTHHL